MTLFTRKSLFPSLSLFARRTTRRGSARRPSRRGNGLRLEPLEGRLLLACEVGPPFPTNCKFVADQGTGSGDGTWETPWRTIPALQAAIYSGGIQPGDVINFRRGDGFKGNLVFPFGGTPTDPITIQPYEGPVPGLARPKIDAGIGTGISVRNGGYMTIRGLEIFGAYDSEDYYNPSYGNGVEFISGVYLSTPPFETYEGIELVDLDIHHFGGCGPNKPNLCAPGQPATGSGIYILGRQPNLPADEYIHYRDIKIYDDLDPTRPDETMEVHDNEVSGILLTDSNRSTEEEHDPAFEQVYIHHVDAYNQKPRVPGEGAQCQPGVPGVCLIGGEGIHLTGVRDGVVERNRVFDNGRNDYRVINAALGASNSQYLLIQYNEVARTLSGGLEPGQGVDGQGIDLDRWSTQSIVQYNFTHNNDGAGIMLGAEGTDVLISGQNVVRYNVSQKDSRNSFWGGILVESVAVSDVDIYGNTVYLTPNGASQPAALTLYASAAQCPSCAPPTLNVYNNLLFTTDVSLPAVRVEQEYLSRLPALSLKGNDYVTGGGFRVEWGDGNPIETLGAFQDCVTGPCQERHNGNAVGASISPNLEDMGKAASIVNIDLLHQELAPFYQLDDPPPEVATGGMNLFAVIGADWWWLGDAFWEQRLGRIARDGFGVRIDDGDPFSMGASQYQQ